MYNENSYENAIIETFKNLGYDYIYAPDLERDFNSPLYSNVLEESIRRINKNLPDFIINEAIEKVKNFELGSLVQKNLTFMEYLQNGVTIQYHEDGENRSCIVYLIDYNNIENNSFIVANQWTFVENSEKRPDVLIFLNGFPIALFELKSPVREETDASDGYRQIRNYMTEIPSMFIYNAVCVISDLLTTKIGTITSGEDRFMEWKTSDGLREDTDCANYRVLLEGVFNKSILLDIIKNFICFSAEEKGDVKILAGYHQYYAVKKAIESVKNAIKTDGKGGVFWHTQGSGKSLSMVFFAHLLQSTLESPTIVVITDRNDLDEQLFGQFSKCANFLRQTPVQAQSRDNLIKLLDGKKANGIIFTTMQKFEEYDKALSERRNIIVMADEAHRSQYGLSEKVDTKTGKIKSGTARLIRDSLPNATYIGFTGTPISAKDRSTIEVFGNYIDVYDMTQAVEDHATKPVYYESRVVKLQLDPKILKQIDEEYDFLAVNAEDSAIEKSKKELSQLDAVLGHDDTINSLVKDIIEHYEDSRANLLTGKAMVVAYSREIAMKIYHKFLELRTNWENKVKVIMTSGNNDPEEWRKIIGNKSYKQQLAKEFKDDNSEFKIAIVVDMWLTGFDVPSLATMYVYKPMVGHNLMQAIARVNRVFKEKEGGLIVDYIGIASALKQAMNDYTNRDKNNYGNMNIEDVAYPKFKEKLEVCKSLFYGFDYSKFVDGSDFERTNCITGGINFILAPEKEENKKDFEKQSLLLKNSLSLCASIAKQNERIEAAYFEAIRVMLVRISQKGNDKKFSLKEINEKINELLKQSIKSDGVINLFSDNKAEVSLFDAAFLQEISKMKERNLSIEMLKKLLTEQLSIYKKTNLVKSEKFSELLKTSMNKYLNGLISNEEVIEELLKIAKEIKENTNVTGLNEEETAFYDALTKPQAIKDFYTNEELINLTKELTETLRKNKTIDWQKRESARAQMRVMIKRLLKKYKYPPEDAAEALDTVMRQCELWADNC